MRITMLCTLLMMSFNTFCQPGARASTRKIIVGELKEKGALVAGLYYQVNGKDSTCLISYRNQLNLSVTDIQTISFSSKEYSLRKLYDLLSSFFGDPYKQEDGYQLPIKLGREDVILSLTRRNDARSIILATKHGFFYLDEQQLMKLFYP